MVRIIKVVINGQEYRPHHIDGEVEVHVEDGPVERILTFGETVREQVLKDGAEAEDSDSPYGDLFGTTNDNYEDEEEDDGSDNWCDDCDEHIDDCTCFDDDEDEDEGDLEDDDDGSISLADMASLAEDEPF